MFDGAIFDSNIFDTGVAVVIPSTSHHGAPLGAARITGPAAAYGPPRRRGSGSGLQADPTGNGTGYINDDELVLEFLL